MLFSTEHNALDNTITHQQAPEVTLWAEKANEQQLLHLFKSQAHWSQGWASTM